VTKPERVAPETCALAGVAQNDATANASDRHIHFANNEVRPQFCIFIPLARSPSSSTWLIME
jgi:hypothetical protein